MNKPFKGIEISGINSSYLLKECLRFSSKYDVPFHQVNETIGSSLIPKSEKIEMLNIAKDNKIGLTFSLTPRPEYSPKSSFYRTSWGKEYGRKINNQLDIEFSIKESFKLSDMGCRGIIVYDIGIISLLARHKVSGELSSNCMLKASSHCMITNHLTADIYFNIGANDLILPHDLPFEMIEKICKKTPKNSLITIPTDSYSDKGGFIRLSEIESIFNLEGNLFLKIGGSVHTSVYETLDSNLLERKFRRIRSLIDAIEITIDANSGDSHQILSCIPE